MTNMPERIWATPFDSEFSSGGTYCDAAERPTAPNHDAWCYIRADASYDAMTFLYKRELNQLKAQCDDLVRMSDNWMRIAEMEGENNMRLREAFVAIKNHVENPTVANAWEYILLICDDSLKEGRK